MPLNDGAHLGIRTTGQLKLPRCPHCSNAFPTLTRRAYFSVLPQHQSFLDPLGGQWLQWHVYGCESCGGAVCAATRVAANSTNVCNEGALVWIIPNASTASGDIPERPAHFLRQAKETIASPSASITMSASAVDAMLKARNYKTGNLYSRIEQAEKDGVLAKEMAEWAHDIRLDANDERHADENAPLPTGGDATRCLDFAEALAELLFELPARVKRGRVPKT